MSVIYICPADKRLLCSWEGYAAEIKQHFESKHNELLYRTNSVEIDVEKLPENKLLCLDKDVYLMQVCKDQGKILLRLRYLGSRTSASKFQYDVSICINNTIYTYNPSRHSSVVPRQDGWKINLDSINNFQEKIETFICTIIVLTPDEEVTIRRKTSDTSLRSYQENIYDDILLVERRINELKQLQEKEDNEENIFHELVEKSKEVKISEIQEKEDYEKKGDYMDRISQLDMAMLEEPFHDKYEKFKKDVENSESLSNIAEERNLSCASCSLALLPHIYMCNNGHNVCSLCRADTCKICNGNIINRNNDLEGLSRTSFHQCRYVKYGCNERFLYNELRAHEAKCNFCIYKCVIIDCPYQGKFNQFSNHLKVVHSSVKVGFSTRNELPKGSELYVLNKSIGIFYCTSQIKDDFVIWRATFCGPIERQFSCEISFKEGKYKEPIFLRRKDNVWEVRKPLSELKKNKTKEKHAILSIISFDS